MRMVEGFAFFPFTFDQSGKLESRDELDAMIERAKAAPRATDVIFLAHGFRNDVDDATGAVQHVPENFQSTSVAVRVQQCGGPALRRRGHLLAVEAVP